MKTLWLLIAMLLGLQSPQVDGVETIAPKSDVKKIGEFSYGLIKVTDPAQLSLIPNYTTSDSSENIVSNNNCTSAISGGFYDVDQKPLGLLIVDGQEINRRKQSALFDGFVSLEGVPRIGTSYSDSASIVLQTGPLLIGDGKQLPLALNSDKSARRMIAAIANQGLYFMTVYNAQAEVLGPYLDDLPRIVEEVGQKENLQFDDAINLDGGRASVFYSPSLTLSESDPVGSVFCVK